MRVRTWTWCLEEFLHLLLVLLLAPFVICWAFINHGPGA
jgi:hypothetical protein